MSSGGLQHDDMEVDALPSALWTKSEGFQQNSVLNAMRMAQLVSQNPNSITHGAVIPLPPRTRVQALGGKYQPIFDYKLEIFGRLARQDRCFICLSTQIVARRWGILFCRDCLKEYVIAKGDLAGIYNYEEILDCATLTPVVVHRTMYYYLPELNSILRDEFDGLLIQTVLMQIKRHSFMMEKERVQRSALEGRRRLMRAKIVLFAQQIWEGHDPIPEKVIDEKSGEVTLIPRPEFSSTQYKAFRERFAPTSKLGTFLFPEYLLVEHPVSLSEEYDAAGGWLPDPTRGTPRTATVDMITNRKICAWAEEMLRQLTSYTDLDYHQRGMGGYVDNWVNAVKQYHVSRLEAEIKSGFTVNLGHVPQHLQGQGAYTRLRDLRTKCGLQAPGAILMPLLPKRPAVGPETAHLSPTEFMRLDRIASRAEANRAEGTKFFNKILRSCCVACPLQSPMTFAKPGLEGLVEHVRYTHRHFFWRDDDFHVVG
ncbi:MAG: hypothetical protein Q9187_001648 [Circinaria calcarea]